MSLSIELIGLFAGFLGVIAWIPQIKEVWIEKSRGNITTYIFLVASALILWLIYGILIVSYSIIIANIAP